MQAGRLVPPDADQDFSFLENFTYDQHLQPRKGDIIHYFDLDIQDWTRVRVIPRSNYHYYYNIRFLDYDRPDDGIYFRPGDVWSHSQPVLNQQELQKVHPVVEDDSLPPPEQERQDFHTNYHLIYRQISLLVEQASSSHIRRDRVYTLPEDDLRGHLSPRSKKKAAKMNLHPAQDYMRSAIAKSLTSESNSAKPQSRIS